MDNLLIKEDFKRADIEVRPSSIHRYGVFAKKSHKEFLPQNF